MLFHWVKKGKKWTSLALAWAILVGGLLPSLVAPQKVQAAAADHVVISQVFGGNGTGYAYDFVELYNPTNEEVDLSGWSVQYGATGNTSSFANITSIPSGKKIAPHGYFLVSGAGSTASSTPAPDVVGSINLSGSNGQVALMSTVTAFNPGSGVTDYASFKMTAGLVDFVGYGTAVRSENDQKAPALTSSTSLYRKNDSGTSDFSTPNGNGWDTDDNSQDFVTGTPAPRNSGGGNQGLKSSIPVGVNALFDNRNAAAATVQGTVYSGAWVRLYLSDPSQGSGSVTTDAYADSTGSFELTFNNSSSNAASVYVTSTEQGKAESDALRIDAATKPSAPASITIAYNVDNTGNGVVSGQAGSVANNTVSTYVYVYNGDPTSGGTLLTNNTDGKKVVMANTDGSFTFKFDNGASIDKVYVTQVTATNNGRSFESNASVIDKSDVVVPTTSKINTIRANTTDGCPVNKAVSSGSSDPCPTPSSASYTIEGTVNISNKIIGNKGSYFMLQDDTGGMTVWGNFEAGALITGDKVRVSGKLGQYNGLTQMDPTNVEKIGSATTPPAPVTKTIEDLNTYATAEPLEGTLVTVEGKITTIPATAAGGGYNISFVDANNKSITVRLMTATGVDVTTLETETHYKITGVVGQFDSSKPFTTGYQIFPRTAADFEKIATAPQDSVPLIYNVHPAKMSATINTRPTISGKVEKTAADLNVSTFKVQLDKQDIAVTLDNGQFSYTPATDLAYGEHQLLIEIADVNGAKNSLISYFYVQKDAGTTNYNYYFGIPHAHTAYSDGKGTPADAFQHAYNNNLDFLIVTDHSNWLDGDTYVSDRKEFEEKAGSEWANTKQMVQDFNGQHAGEFLAMRGFEMTSSSWGHANVYNADKYVEAKQTVTDLGEFYEWLTNQENVVASFNHPNWPDNSFKDLSYVPEVDHIMSMIEVGNGAPPYSYARAESHFFKAMDNGWHVGANNAQDNHSTNWGDPDNLTAVIAEDLTYDSFMEALKNRRMYSTEARDTQLRVKANGYWMGSTLDVQEGTKLAFDVWVKDESNPIDKIELITNGGKVIATKASEGKTEDTWTPEVTTAAGANWYVVKVYHTDGKWTTASAIYTAGGEMDVKLTGVAANPSPALPGTPTELTASITNMGVRGVENLEVKFYHTSVAPENLVGTGTLAYVAPNKTGTAKATWTPQQSGQDTIIAVLTDKPGITTVTEMSTPIKIVQSNGKKVLVDSYHDNKEVPGVMKDFFELLRRYGYSAVENKQELTDSLLAGYDVMVLNTPTSTSKNLSDSEMEAVAKWVKAGGSLMMATTSNFGFADNDMLNPLLEKMQSGIRINNDNVYEPNTSTNYSGGMKWSVYARTFPSSITGLNSNMEAIRFFSGSSLVNANKQALVNNPATELEILLAGNKESYNFNVKEGYYTYNPAIGTEEDPNQTSGPDGEKIPLIAKEKIGNGKLIVSGRHFYSDYEIPNDVSNTAFTLQLMDWMAGFDRVKSIKEVRETAQEGDIVTVKGVVTAPTNKFFDTVYIQDETSGLSLYGTQGKDLPVGTVVIATGGVHYFEGELELAYEVADMEVLYLGPGTPYTAQSVTAAEVASGAHLGKLLKVQGQIKEINDAGSYIVVNDGSNDARVFTDGYLPLDLGRFKVGDWISAQGIASTDMLGNRIRVRFAEDLAMAEPDTVKPVWTNGSLKVTSETATSVKVSWSGASDNVGVTQYKVYNGDVSTTVTGTTYEFTGLTPNTTYQFKVEARDAAGNWTDNGPVLSVTTKSASDTEKPSWISGVLNAIKKSWNSFSLSWTGATDNEAVTEYKIYQNDKVIATITDSTYEVSDLEANKTYQFKVEAGDAAGNWTDNGPSQSVTTDHAPDTAKPTWASDAAITVDSKSTSSIKLKWSGASDNVGVTQYKVSIGDVVKTVTQATYEFTGLNSNTSYKFKVEAGDAAGNWTENGPSLTVTTNSTSSGSDTGTTTTTDTNQGQQQTTPPATQPKPEQKNEVQVPQEEKVETAPDGSKTVVMTVKAEDLAKALESVKGSNKPTITVKTNSSESQVKAELPAGSLVTAAQTAPNAVISIQSGDTSYNLPLSVLDIASLSQQLGADAKDVKLIVSIEKVRGNAAKQIEDTASGSGVTIVGTPIEFNVSVEANGKTAEINNFGGTYVTRTITISDKVNAEQTTVLLVDPVTGAMSFVPATFLTVNGQTVVTIMRNGNSIYTVAQTSKTFADAGNHWAKADIELMASKLIVKGISDNAFGPDQNITRAEFAALVTRALGLTEDKDAAKFKDVSAQDWFAGAVGAAVKAKLVEGFEDGGFKPNALITREQMAVMISRALQFTGKATDVNSKQVQLLSGFKDKAKISTWAQAAVAQAVDSKIIEGMDGGQFVPADNATRAQAAVMLKRLLKFAQFID
ncbi:S-layer homology domain-containing protein [Paenibacillus chartarius]|uniref:S-layer homology domain-containing protein n=1 Tax=Paenibacillus chartarius TaxID=747481 RepID=A0ABV6DLA1_9BACL